MDQMTVDTWTHEGHSFGFYVYRSCASLGLSSVPTASAAWTLRSQERGVLLVDVKHSCQAQFHY
jgi:hypothetical protein